MRKRERIKLAEKKLREILEENKEIDHKDIKEAAEKLYAKIERKMSKDRAIRDYVNRVAFSYYVKNKKRIPAERVLFYIERFWGVNANTQSRRNFLIKMINEEIDRAKYRYYNQIRKEKKEREDFLSLIKEMVEKGEISVKAASILAKFFIREELEYEKNGKKESNAVSLYKTLEAGKRIKPEYVPLIEQLQTKIVDKASVLDNELYVLEKITDYI